MVNGLHNGNQQGLANWGVDVYVSEKRLGLNHR